MENNAISYNDLLIENKRLVSENKRLQAVEKDINKAKELYLKIFEDFPALIWRSRLDKLCDYFNRTWLEFTGRTFDQEFGNGWAEGVHPDDFQYCLDIYVNAFDKREAFYMEYRLKNKFGQYRWIRDYGRPFYDLDNTFLGYIGSCYDITENKENEQKLIHINASKDKLFSIIAHDLRNPFSSLIGTIELLQAKLNVYDKNKIETILGEMLKTTVSTYEMLENLLQWARSQESSMKPVYRKTNIKKTVSDVIDSLSGLAKNKEIKTIISCNEDIFCDTDKNMFETIIRNIYTNAIKFSHKGKTIEIEAKKAENMVEVSVQDQGIGMSAESMKDIFSYNDKKTNRGTNNETGTGLGMILCKELVEKLGGKIWVESEEGKGSCFKFTLSIVN